MLAAWAASPTRFREDANAEEDLLLGGYADRWLVELAQNAADAARRAGAPGRLLVRVVPGDAGAELRVANTGAPLDAAGVAALASLRASAKRDAETVGRFGVGFAAVLGVSHEPRIASAAGGVRFSSAATRAEVAALAGAAPGELARRGGRPPVLRLPWPLPAAEPDPPQGYDTEVRLPLLDGVRPTALTASAERAAPELLLALPWLAEITVLDRAGRPGEHRRTEAADGTVTLGPSGQRWRLARRAGRLTSTPAAAEDRADWAVCWALPLGPDGRPAPLTEDVLHAPTPSDERLSLPARLLAELPMQPSRRRVRPGPATDEVVRAAAETYLDLVHAVSPVERAALAPTPGFPLGELDDAVRAAVSDVLAGAAWLPAAAPGRLLAPRRARLLDPPGSPELAELVAAAVPELLAGPAQTAPRAALAALGARPLGPAELADRLVSVRWAPPRWRAVYAALAEQLDAVPSARDELAGLPVPLADGRTVAGARGALVLDGDPDWVAAVTEDLAALALPGVRIVHPDAAHPLLRTLGATAAGPAEVLDHPGVAEAVLRAVDQEPDPDPEPPPVPPGKPPVRPGKPPVRPGKPPVRPGKQSKAASDLARLVLALVAEIGGATEPGAAAGRPGRPWLAALPLPDADGQPRRADELMLPDAAIRPVLAPDPPLGVLDAGVAARYPRRVLTSVGVLDTFAVLVDDDPVGPDHDLHDEARWWDGLDEPPPRLVAVRDLDLVDDHAWPAALALLLADPAGRAAVYAEPSYTAWWLARHARLAGRRPGQLRLPSAVALAGLFDPPPPAVTARIPEALLAAVGMRGDLIVRDRFDAAVLLDRLADPGRSPDSALTWRAHAELAAAVVAGRLDPRELGPPGWLRSSAGTVVEAERAVLLDRGWLAPALPPAESVPGVLATGEQIRALADLFDLPLASELVSGVVTGEPGRPARWAELAEVVAACAVIGAAVPGGELCLHTVLTVWVTRPSPARLAVPVWRDDEGRWHAADPVRGLLARLTDR